MNQQSWDTIVNDLKRDCGIIDGTLFPGLCKLFDIDNGKLLTVTWFTMQSMGCLIKTDYTYGPGYVS